MNSLTSLAPARGLNGGNLREEARESIGKIVTAASTIRIAGRLAGAPLCASIRAD
jgi:hypothetical protein